jgi:O-antigen/teichoic acid export membrane protein
MTRTEMATKNMIAGLISKILSLILGFIARTIFIYYLGNIFLGVNGLFTEILSVLSFAELGFGTALNYELYKPIVNNDKDKIVKLINFYKKTYRLIACIVALCGIVIMFFLQYIVKGADFLNINQLRLFYLIFLFNTVVSYFVSYKFSYVNANQKNYIITNIDTIINSIIFILQIISILLTKSFLIYLLVKSFGLLISRFYIAIYLNKKFPILNQKNKDYLTKEEKKPIFNNVKGLVIHNFSSIAIHSTDNIIISSLSGLGVIAVGLVSNYNLLINSVLGFVTIIFLSVTAGFGNLVAASTTENYRKSFLELNFLNFWIYGFCCIAFFILIPPFIQMWIGKENLIDNISFLLIVINAYLMGQSTIFNNTRIAKGNFQKDKWWSLLQAVVNLVVSIIGAKYLGLIGVYIGTIVSRLIFVIFRPFSTYKMMFNKSSKEYYIKLLIYSLVVACTGIITYYCCSLFVLNVNALNFLILSLIVLIIPNFIFFILFYKTAEYNSLKIRIKNIIKK